jgi:hypothetical protein
MPSLPSAHRDQCRSETPNDKHATISRAAITVFSRLDFFNAKVADVARAAGVTERLGCDLDLTVVSRGNFTSRQNSLNSSPRPSFAPICANCAMPSPTDKPPMHSQLDQPTTRRQSALLISGRDGHELDLITRRYDLASEAETVVDLFINGLAT